MTTEYRQGLPERPERIARLPLDARGYPIPFFVMNRDGVLDFRVVDHDKVVRAAEQNQCFICGDKLGRHKFFAAGPKSMVVMQSSHGPSHKECVEYALKACPFILYPAHRRTAAMPDIPLKVDEGVQIERPPIYGVAHVEGEYELMVGGNTMRCQWSEIDYTFWLDGAQINMSQAYPHVEAAVAQVIQDVMDAKKPDAWPEARFQGWIANHIRDVRAKSNAVLTWMNERRIIIQ